MSNISLSLINDWSEQQCLEYLPQTDSEHLDLDTLRDKCRDKFLEKLLQKESISLGEVIYVEKNIISQQRLNRLEDKSSDSTDENSTDDSDFYYGIAISGGGIRSASFALGILQALCQSNKLKYFDYMSAVSGGGYIASCLTWFNRKKRDDSNFQQANSTTPFCKLFNTDATLDTKIAGYKDKTSLNYLRQNGKYLTPTKDLNTLALVGTIAGNAFVAAAVYFSCLLVVFWLFKGFNFYDEIPKSMPEIFNSFLWLEQISWLKLFLHLLVYFLLLLVVFSMLNTYRVDKHKEANILEGILAEKYKKRRNLQIWIGKTVSFIVVIAILATLPDVWHLISLLYQYLVQDSTTNGADLELGGISIGVVLGVIGAIYQFFRQNIPEKKYSIITDIRIILTAMILIYSVLLFAWKVSDKYDSLLELLLSSGNSKEAWLIAIVPWLFVMSGWVIDINYFGIRQMYRDRLMEIFLPNMSIFDENNENPFRWSPATNADQADIQDMCGSEDFGPYLILNANAVLMNSKNARYRNRGGDNYMLSSQFIGCLATGWSHITQLKYPSPLTLGAAMSISGAAVNPHAGVGGKGLTRGRLVSMTLSFLNIRLGYWFENPALASKNKWKKFLNRPNLLFSGIQGVLGIGSHENNDYIELTDGGHFDNTGLYELFRRRLKVILLSQAGADPDFTVDDIGNAIQRARSDFGAHVYFVPDYGLNELVPGTEKPVGLSSKIELSKNPYAIALIKYAVNEFGVLIIIKTVLTKGLSADLYSYKLSNKMFPNQSTTDQFFSEDQFEAYRELGFGLCYKMLNGEFGRNLSWSKPSEWVDAVRWKTLLAYKPDIDGWDEEECRGFLGNAADKLSDDDLKNACKKKISEDKGV